jgi:hypothetical protein
VGLGLVGSGEDSRGGEDGGEGGVGGERGSGVCLGGSGSGSGFRIGGLRTGGLRAGGSRADGAGLAGGESLVGLGAFAV